MKTKKRKKVLITGIQGQDGSTMAEYLLENTDHDIIATARRVSNRDDKNLQTFKGSERVQFDILDLNDQGSIDQAIKKHQPDYFINLGASAFVPDSWNAPSATMITNTVSVIHILESIRKNAPNCRFYNASSSEIFGDVLETPQNGDTPPNPRSIYGVSKNAAKDAVKVYRASYGLYAVSGILYNHEGRKRAEHYVTRKITKQLAQIKKGEKIDPLELGNLDAKRDWTDARDMMRGVWLMLNQDEPKDYVLASGVTRSVEDFVNAAVKALNIKNVIWSGNGLDKKLISMKDSEIKPGEGGVVLDTMWLEKDKTLVKVNPKFFRPAEVELLLGDASKAKEELGWEPEISFEDMVKDMVKEDLK